MATATYSRRKSDVSRELRLYGGLSGYREQAKFLNSLLNGPEIKGYSRGDLIKIKRVVDKFETDSKTATMYGVGDDFHDQRGYILIRMKELLGPQKNPRDMNFPQARRYFLENLRDAERGKQPNILELERLAGEVRPVLKKAGSKTTLRLPEDLENYSRQQRNLEKLVNKALANAYLKQAEGQTTYANYEGAKKSLVKAARIFGKLGDDKGIGKANKGLEEVEAIRYVQKNSPGAPKSRRGQEGFGFLASDALRYRKIILDRTSPEPVRDFARQQLERLAPRIKSEVREYEKLIRKEIEARKA